MKQVKVTETEPYKDSQVETIVCKGKVVLVKSGLDKDSIHLCDKRSGFEGHYKPIIISETECREIGDKVYSKLYQTIVEIKSKEDVEDSELCKKILALPENFPPKHLQAIVDGKFKDRDEVLVECEFVNMPAQGHGTVNCSHYRIKPNKDNHIKLFPVKRARNKMIDKLDIYSGDLNTERIKAYKELAKAYNIQEGTVRDIFCKGAEWVIDLSERE